MLRVLAIQASHTVEHGRGVNRVYIHASAHHRVVVAGRVGVACHSSDIDVVKGWMEWPAVEKHLV